MNMSNVHYLPEEELVQKALAALMSTLGPVETMRFLTLSRAGRMESVLRHHQWQSTLDRKAFYDAVFAEE
ncbi:MAG: hypothetical protein BroJett015_40610 [Chloroflexota bacterium]|nr:MAG: hypothetical protein BroJett015_40610 [Chloroflexota bacterium]